MKISISGASGFLGKALHSYLELAGNQVNCIKRFNPSRNSFYYNNKNKDYQQFDYELVSNFFLSHRKNNIFIHSATNYGRDDLNAPNPSPVFWSNVHFPVVLLEKAIENNYDTFINIDTFFSSNNSHYSYMSDYSLSKKHFREWGSLYGKAGLIRFINIRLFHLYGPGDSSLKFIPQIIQKCLLHERIDLTDGMQRRDFIFIEDAIDAINTILVAESSKPAGFENYDLGTGASTSIRELVETIKTITNSSSILNFGILKRREGEFINSFADIKHLKRLGWTQNTSLLNGLTATVNYYK